MAYQSGNAPYHGLASLMAMKGRYGDTELVHMSKPEVAALNASGKLTTNPSTGLPEAFNLSMQSVLPIALGIAGSILLPGAGTALGSGLGAAMAGAFGGSALGSLVTGQSLGESLKTGALSAAGTGIGGAFAGESFAGVPSQAAEQAGVQAENEAIQGQLKLFPS